MKTSARPPRVTSIKVPDTAQERRETEALLVESTFALRSVGGSKYREHARDKCHEGSCIGSVASLEQAG